MARHTITEAIRLTGISRTQMYNHYIKKSLIKVSEANGKKYIDTSDLIAAFGELKALNTPEQIDTKKDSRGLRCNGTENPVKQVFRSSNGSTAISMLIFSQNQTQREVIRVSS